MEIDVRTNRGKLIGKYDLQTQSFGIKDGSKVTRIEVPPDGLKLSYTAGDGIIEEVYISPRRDTPHIA